MEDLERFLIAQNGKSIHGNTLYEQALIEIQEGKLGFECWIRYVYPQLKRSGTSQLTTLYGLKDRDEAKAYIEHPLFVNQEIAPFSPENEQSLFGRYLPAKTQEIGEPAALFG